MKKNKISGTRMTRRGRGRKEQTPETRMTRILRIFAEEEFSGAPLRGAKEEEKNKPRKRG
jgi:hypothetical protein